MKFFYKMTTVRSSKQLSSVSLLSMIVACEVIEFDIGTLLFDEPD